MLDPKNGGFKMVANTLVVLGTGGTIAGRAGRAEDVLGYTAGQVPVSDLLAGVVLPKGWLVECVQVAQVDSKDMGVAVWRALLGHVQQQLLRPEVGGVVITHGTDTLEETAYLLHAALPAHKPVVMTCAMRPANAPAPDGPQNLADALLLAAHPGASGVVVVCAGQVFAGSEVQKRHTYRLDAFDAGDAGPLGVVEAGCFRQWRQWPLSPPGAETLLMRLLDTAVWPRVFWVTSHAGADPLAVRRWLPQGPGTEAACEGVLVAGTGNGTLHQALETSLQEATQCGLRVWITTRCHSGVVMGHAGQPWVDCPLPPSKARLALVFDLLLNPHQAACD